MTAQPDYAALFAASPYPYLLIDPGFIIIGANPSYLRSTGRTADELVGQNIFDAFPANPDDPGSTNLDEVRVSIELAIATRQPHTSALLRYAVPRDTPEGRVFDERYWSAVHSPVFDAGGAVAYVAQNAIDVTDLYRFDVETRTYYLKQDANAVPDISQMNRPQLHEAMTRILAAERGQLQTLFNQAPGFIAMLTGSSHMFDLANAAFLQLVGHRQLLGRPALEALPELAAQGFHALLDSAFQSGTPTVVRGKKFAFQDRHAGPPADRYVDLVVQPIVGDDGRVTGIFVQGNDVTSAHHADTALRAERDQSQYIFDSMDEGFAVLDRHWTILRMNAAGLRLTAKTAEEVIGRNHWKVWPELRHTPSEQAYRRVMATGRTEVVEIAHTLPGGPPAWMEIRAHGSQDGGIADRKSVV